MRLTTRRITPPLRVPKALRDAPGRAATVRSGLSALSPAS